MNSNHALFILLGASLATAWMPSGFPHFGRPPLRFHEPAGARHAVHEDDTAFYITIQAPRRFHDIDLRLQGPSTLIVKERAHNGYSETFNLPGSVASAAIQGRHTRPGVFIVTVPKAATQEELFRQHARQQQAQEAAQLREKRLQEERLRQETVARIQEQQRQEEAARVRQRHLEAARRQAESRQQRWEDARGREAPTRRRRTMPSFHDRLNQHRMPQPQSDVAEVISTTTTTTVRRVPANYDGDVWAEPGLTLEDVDEAPPRKAPNAARGFMERGELHLY